MQLQGYVNVRIESHETWMSVQSHLKLLKSHARCGFTQVFAEPHLLDENIRSGAVDNSFQFGLLFGGNR
jgi:hypothetical protein